MDPYRNGPPPIAYGYEQAQAAALAKDDQDLKVLSILHFVYAGIIAFTGILLVAYLVIAAALVASTSSAAKPSAGEAAVVGTVFIVIFGSLILLLWVKAALLVYSGLSLRKLERKLLSQIVAVLACINLPFGTALGVYTLVVLSRPSISWRYAKNRLA
ncbi:MAG TPA: hypothetical protein VGM29_01365 [Polyangiaceae bacterium]|jgi:hypothetical protein